MSWLNFSVIFESPSDKARAITFVISTCVALVILFINDRLSKSRSDRELMIDKLESVVDAILDIEVELIDIATKCMDGGGSRNIMISHQNTLLILLGRVEKYILLYFPKIHFRPDEYYISYHEIFETTPEDHPYLPLKLQRQVFDAIEEQRDLLSKLKERVESEMERRVHRSLSNRILSYIKTQ